MPTLVNKEMKLLKLENRKLPRKLDKEMKLLELENRKLRRKLDKEIKLLELENRKLRRKVKKLCLAVKEVYKLINCIQFAGQWAKRPPTLVDRVHQLENKYSQKYAGRLHYWIGVKIKELLKAESIHQLLKAESTRKGKELSIKDLFVKDNLKDLEE